MSCPSLSHPLNGNVALSSGNAMGSTATYTCNNGYRASFTATRYCQADGQWSGGEPSCIRKCLPLKRKFPKILPCNKKKKIIKSYNHKYSIHSVHLFSEINIFGRCFLRGNWSSRTCHSSTNWDGWRQKCPRNQGNFHMSRQLPNACECRCPKNVSERWHLERNTT